MKKAKLSKSFKFGKLRQRKKSVVFRGRLDSQLVIAGADTGAGGPGHPDASDEPIPQVVIAQPGQSQQLSLPNMEHKTEIHVFLRLKKRPSQVPRMINWCPEVAISDIEAVVFPDSENFETGNNRFGT